MAAPQVQDLNDLINQYKTTLAPQQAVIDSSIAANDVSGQQQIQGIDAQKTTAFKGITQAANDRGGYFSGFSPNEEATYTAGTYLPALAQLQGTIAQTRASLLGKKADLDTTASTSALTAQQQQKSQLQTWQDQQDQLAAQAAEAEKARAFTASQQTAQNAFTASQNAADRASKASATPDVGAIVNSITSFFQKGGKNGSTLIGRDGKVSPDTFQAGREKWVAAGGDPASYAQAFYKYVNTGQQSKYF
jgi:hypothetical protein